MSTYYDEVVVIVGRPHTNVAKAAFAAFHARVVEIFKDADGTAEEGDDHHCVSEIVTSSPRWHCRSSFFIGAWGTKTCYHGTHAMKLLRGLLREISMMEDNAPIDDRDDNLSLTMALVDMGNDCNESDPKVVEYDGHDIGPGRPGYR